MKILEKTLRLCLKLYYWKQSKCSFEKSEIDVMQYVKRYKVSVCSVCGDNNAHQVKENWEISPKIINILRRNYWKICANVI